MLKSYAIQSLKLGLES